MWIDNEYVADDSPEGIEISRLVEQYVDRTWRDDEEPTRELTEEEKAAAMSLLKDSEVSFTDLVTETFRKQLEGR
jgi:ClpP class serine protease